MSTVAGSLDTDLSVAPLSASYWEQSRSPLASLIFVMPLLALYEGAALFAGAGAARNGADIWLRQFLAAFGMSEHLVLPVAIIIVLLIWQHLTGQPWQARPAVLGGMLAESVVYAAALVLIAQAHGGLILWAGGVCSVPGTTGIAEGAARIISFLGAGIYEELLFRLVLLSAATAALRHMIKTREVCQAAAIVVTSGLFAAAHYIGPMGEPFNAYSCTFRFLAGSLFALLYVHRGFGVAAGTHAMYDIMAGLS